MSLPRPRPEPSTPAGTDDIGDPGLASGEAASEEVCQPRTGGEDELSRSGDATRLEGTDLLVELVVHGHARADHQIDNRSIEQIEEEGASIHEHEPLSQATITWEWRNLL